MKQFLFKFGKPALAILVIGICGYFGVSVSADTIKDLLTSPTVSRPAPVFNQVDAGK